VVPEPNDVAQLVGIISRRDLDLALHHGFAHAPVKGYMQTNIQAITPDTTLPEIQALMVTYDVGRLPVLRNGELVGIVTRTDVLRHRYQLEMRQHTPAEQRATASIATYSGLPERLLPALWTVLQTAAQLAQERGWQLYLVGGAVRDLLLASEPSQLLVPDLDLVVDGFDRAADEGAGVELAQALHQIYPAARMNVHGQFQTAALLWHQDPVLDSLAIDIATARTEFYPYPAANPEVEASSIQQDLYRRDFTINALAIRLTPPQVGKLLDFFGGALDLQAKQIRVLHANSFIEDPTRIYRGVRFAVRLGFTIEPQTINYIKYAIGSGVYDRTLTQNAKAPALQTRLRSELKYILQTDYWLIALEQLNDLDALRCLHPALKLDDELQRRLQLGNELIQSDSLKHLIPNLSPWLVRLEVLLTALNPADRLQVAQQLQLPEDSLHLLAGLDRAHQEIATTITDDLSIGQIVSVLQGYQPTMVLLLTIISQDKVSAKLYQYLTNWSHIKAPITGSDLKALGYRPGMHYKQMLDAVLVATLDGKITNHAQAIEFIQQQYSLLDRNFL
jgi:tRNA nucleotidyltransferase (CCA-adding enzyme)